MFTVSSGGYEIGVLLDREPELHGLCRQHAKLIEHFDASTSESDASSLSFVSVAHPGEFPFLLVTQRYDSAYSFHPGAILVAETKVLFIGAGTRLLAYDLTLPKRPWEDTADFGFHGWRQHGDCILMTAELEFSAWDLHAKKLWTTFVEPPWEYAIEAGQVNLDVMGTKVAFNIHTGPTQEQRRLYRG